MKVRRFYPLQVLRKVMVIEGELTSAEIAVRSYATIAAQQIRARVIRDGIGKIGGRIIWGGCKKCDCSLYTGQKTGICMTILTAGLLDVPVGRCAHGPDEHDSFLT